MKQAPPHVARPWYYQTWFLFPAFFLWPLWPILVLRSPWHNNILAGAIAWAMLFVGGFVVAMRLAQSGTVAYSTVALVLPGLFLTLVTQTLWVRHKRELAATGQTPAPSSSFDSTLAEGSSRLSPRARRLRRRPSRRGSNPGRYSRHPR